MFVTYLLRELRRRMRQAIFIALGLALGVGLVITVTAASDGVRLIGGTPGPAHCRHAQRPAHRRRLRRRPARGGIAAPCAGRGRLSPS
jgi:hypothetical protein